MDPTSEQLVAEITHDPEKLGLADAVAAGSDSGVADILNAPRVLSHKSSTFLTELGVLHILGPTNGEIFLQSMAAVSLSDHPMAPILKRILRIVEQSSGSGNPDAGIDVGSPVLQAMIRQLADAGAIAPDSRDALLAYGSRLWSRAEVLWGEGIFISHEQIAVALRGA